MSDAGLEADLLLDVRQALRAVEQVNEALNRATTGIVVTADTRAITASIDAAVQNANTALTVIADAGDITGSIDAAVQDANTQLSLFADAADITGSINAAVTAADTNVVVTADTSQAAAQVERLDDNLDRAGGSADRLKQLLTVAAFASVAKGIYEVAQAASAMAESTSKATVVFGDAFGDVESFTLAAATSIGLSRAEALEAAGTFGNLFNALGLTKQAAAELAPDVLTLGADLASFNNLGVDETLEKIRSGLVGEIEPLRSLGISFLAADVAAKAMELGLADANGEISEGAKVQARWALIMEQSINATGDFARTSDGLANQQRILTAEFKNAQIAAGEGLVPIMLELVRVGREEFLPTAEVIASDLLPALGRSMAAIAESGGASLLNILAALTPVTEALAFTLELIPAPLLAAAVTSGTLLRAVTLLSPAFRAARLEGATFGTAIAATNPYLLAFVAVATVVSKVLGDNARAEAERREAIESVRGSLGEAITTQEAYTKSLEAASEDSRGFREGLSQIGLTTDSLAKNLATITDAENAYAAALGIEGAATERSSAARQRFNDLIAEGKPEVLEQIAAINDAAQAELEAAVVSERFTQAQIDAGVARATLADGTVNYAAVLARLRDEEIRHAEALKPVIAEGDALAQQYVDITAAGESLREESTKVASAIDAIRFGASTSDRELLNMALALSEAELSEEGMADAAARLGTDVDTLTGFVETATGAIDDFVSRAASQLPSVADLFGDTLRDSEQAISDRVSAIADGGNEEAAAIRDASAERADATKEGAADRAEAIRDAADDQIEQIKESADAEADAVIEAASNGLDFQKQEARKRAEAIREAAADRADAVRDAADEEIDRIREASDDQADAIREGGDSSADAVIDAAQAQADAQKGAGTVTAAALAQNLRDQAGEIDAFRLRLKALTEAGFVDLAATIAEQGPEVGGALATELVTALQTGNVALVEELDTAQTTFETSMQSMVDFLRDVIGPEMLLAGTSLADSFGENLDFAERVRISTELAADGLSGDMQKVATVAAVEGEAAARAYGDALDLDQRSIDEAVKAGTAIKENAPTAKAGEAGEDVGRSFLFGVVAGLTGDLVTNVEDAGAAAVRAALKGAQTESDSHSPSRLFAREVGLPIAQGIAVGIAEGTAAVTSEIEKVIAAAAQQRIDVPAVTVAPAISGSIDASTIAGSSGGMSEAAVIAAARELAATGGRRQVFEAGAFHVVAPDPVLAATETARKLEDELWRQDDGG